MPSWVLSILERGSDLLGCGHTGHTLYPASCWVGRCVCVQWRPSGWITRNLLQLPCIKKRRYAIERLSRTKSTSEMHWKHGIQTSGTHWTLPPLRNHRGSCISACSSCTWPSTPAPPSLAGALSFRAHHGLTPKSSIGKPDWPHLLSCQPGYCWVHWSQASNPSAVTWCCGSGGQAT